MVHKGQDFQTKRGSDVTGHLLSEGDTGLIGNGLNAKASSAGGDSGHLFLMFGGTSLCRAYGISLLVKILTDKN